MTAISDKLGGLMGFLGSPLGGEIPAANGGLKQEFQNGNQSTGIRKSVSLKLMAPSAPGGYLYGSSGYKLSTEPNSSETNQRGDGTVESRSSERMAGMGG